MGVEWAEIEGHPDYRAHRDGLIYSYLSHKFLTPGLTRGGYESVGLKGDEGIVQHRVNRLICRSFHGEPTEAQPLALHRNGNRRDNRADNLRWGSAAENAQDMFTHRNHRSQRHYTPYCPQGHLVEGDNRITLKSGARRCRKCKEADRLTRRQKGLEPGDSRHGTLTGYTGWGCKCEPCFLASKTYRDNTKENN